MYLHVLTVGPKPLMPTLLDYLWVSQIQNESPGVPFGSPNLRIKASLDIFFLQTRKISEFYLQVKKILRFLVKDGFIVKFYWFLVYVRPF